ncbi:MAG: WbqC family protein [Saprospiraceae bacterium]|nr:WbqC family protein [Saprospiraceae bacterium]
MIEKAIVEIQYLPCIQYISKWYLYKEVRLEAHENYSKGSFRNRSMIGTSMGPRRLSIPLLKGKNSGTSIKDIKIANDNDWQTQHWRSIKTAYNSAPYFEFYQDDLIPFYKKPYEFLWDFNLELMEKIFVLLGNPQTFQTTTDFEKEPSSDYADLRNQISPKVKMQDPTFNLTAYGQVFEANQGFMENLSVIDLIFCLGPASSLTLSRSIVTP